MRLIDADDLKRAVAKQVTHTTSELSQIYSTALLKKYSCHCCGTELTTSEEGYTPQCKNCGALMHIV